MTDRILSADEPFVDAPSWDDFSSTLGEWSALGLGDDFDNLNDLQALADGDLELLAERLSIKPMDPDEGLGDV